MGSGESGSSSWFIVHSSWFIAGGERMSVAAGSGSRFIVHGS